ncbi:hypothetical protein ACWDTI_02070 [Gordonia sp. NPDC003424]
MTAIGRIAGFAVALIAVFGIAFGVGNAVGPWEHAPWSPSTSNHAPVQSDIHQHME